ncbi:selenium metabolism-associated LysR family transcriptional regulator [Pseudoflavonifractor phocaeensis]|uniref:selenium metabolism-associated LysR family transcriptional regulator n=1 Tax=Pseudoflavonifractor phocaeensis TaxID=1870988 RepID=UPI00195B8C4C|nr:selenium metabolism-associated LysR family transcriptional regulator [Pseudoflavonifractor phocaeensis]MBM6924924.1 LysR family transcriptional regulator [Pseudoflavonifractor phocaeensis]
MQLKQLEIFLQVAQLHSFSKAAEALYLTQPTVSAHVAALEDELGTRLVVRSTKELRLTAPGRVLSRYAAEILGLCQRAAQDVRTSASAISGTLSIAASTVPSQYLLPQVLPLLRQRYPDVFFQIRQGDSSQVTQWMAENGAELGLVGAPVQRVGLLCVPFFTERLVIVTPNTPEYRALGGEMPVEVLKTAPYLVREAGSGTRKQGEQYLRGVGVDPKNLCLAAQLESTESILQGVKNGLGISILSGCAAREAAEEGKILAFSPDSPLLERQFYLLYRRSSPLSPAASMLLEELLCFYQSGV